MKTELKDTEDLSGKVWTFEDLEGSATNQYVAQEILIKDVYKLREVHLGPSDHVVDAGANIGIFTIAVALRFGCAVTAIEPIPTLFELHKRNCERYSIPPGLVERHCVALGPTENASITIRCPAWSTGNSSAWNPNGDPYEVITKTLGQFIRWNTKYVKIDVEGAEYGILEEAIPKLRNVPYLAIEVHRNIPGHDPQRFIDSLKRVYPGELFTMIGG